MDSKCAWDTSLIEPPSCPLRITRWTVKSENDRAQKKQFAIIFCTFGIDFLFASSQPEETRADIQPDASNSYFYNPLGGT